MTNQLEQHSWHDPTQNEQSMHVNQLAIATCDVFHFFPMQGYLSVQTGEKVVVLYIGTTGEEKHWTYARRIIPQYKEDYGWLHMNNIRPDNKDDPTQNEKSMHVNQLAVLSFV